MVAGDKTFNVYMIEWEGDYAAGSKNNPCRHGSGI
jgi:hypothetical protein